MPQVDPAALFISIFSIPLVAVALLLCMVFSVLPTPANTVETGNDLTALELPGLSRLDNDKTAEDAAKYAEDEMVTLRRSQPL